MPGQYCFVCASDEGIFLDVTLDNRSTFHDQIETCFSVKINESVELSSKICYKCAYELDQCTKFVQKYKKSHEVTAPELKDKTSMPYCFLCCESVESDHIFDITKDNNVIFNPLRKIRSIFNDDLSKKNSDSKLICLACRYNLDVLYDLKRIYRETVTNLKALINEEINYTNFPKIHTEVVNRKTTVTTFLDVTFCGLVNSDSDDNENMTLPKRRGRGRPRGKVRTYSQGKAQTYSQGKAQIYLRSNLKSKVRNCDQCHSAVANGIDMYRFHHTGLTVCKNCWIMMDPSTGKIQLQSRHTQSNLVKTKLCSVLLKDVLSQGLYKKQKVVNEVEKGVEKDKDDDASYVALDDGSQEEAKSSESNPLSVASKARNHAVNGKARRGRKRRIGVVNSRNDVERTPLKVTRFSKEHTNASETKPPKASDADEQPSNTPLPKKRGRKRTIDNRSSDSEGSLEQKETRRNKLNDRVNKPNKKKQKSEETTLTARSESSNESSNEDDISLEARSKTKSTTSSSITRKESDRSTRSRTRSSSISSTEMTSPTEFKSPKSVAQSEVKTEYTCDKCNKKFDTKLSNAKHRLTHLKQAALKLEKLTVPSIKEKQETEVDSQDDKISKEAQSRSSRTVSIDKHTDDPSEEVAINIEDDTDDEEIFSLSNKGKAKKKTAKETNGKSDSVIDKPDATESESRVEEESVEKENIKTEESERCEESTVVADETLDVEVENDEDAKDTDIIDKNTTEDEDTILSKEDSDKSEDKDTDAQTVIMEDVEEDKDVEMENDTKVSFIEKEKSISECNTDIDYSESCKNDLETNCKGDEDVIMEDPESIQCDLTDESLEKNTKEPEEKIQKTTSDVADKTETLNDKKDLDDIIVVNEDHVEALEKRENVSDEESMEVEMIADIVEPNSAKDTMKPDLSNGEKHNGAEDDDEDDITVVPVTDSNDDRAKHKKATEETITTDDSKDKKRLEEEIDDITVVPVTDSNDDSAKHEKTTEETITTDDSKDTRRLEEEIMELENLVENTTNDQHEVQENSIYVPDDSPADAANEILKEVFELAAAEVQHREEGDSTKKSGDIEMETLENISREIRKSADMPSLDPISIMDIDDDNSITLN